MYFFEPDRSATPSQRKLAQRDTVDLTAMSAAPLAKKKTLVAAATRYSSLQCSDERVAPWNALDVAVREQECTWRAPERKGAAVTPRSRKA